ncbi:chaplin [Streptomyces virginiae]|nr:chaplin [Streptomyces virginiae]MCX5175007.1 chaplin [Streptomyces virginiae]MCX5277299.1 chaplin [Streptomyces virginiae]WSC82649.1 chaplin [Streptomyces virginiae]
MGGASSASADATAEGIAAGSPGVLSGNVIQIPVHIPINLCGNSINVIGALNPAAGNVCVNA